MKFQRIQDLRIDNDLTIKEISAMLGLHRDVYTRKEKGLRDIPIDKLIKKAEIKHTSKEYQQRHKETKKNKTQNAYSADIDHYI